MPLKHDTSHLSMLKHAIEELFGSEAWYDLKETTSEATWRKYLLKLLKALRISVHESIDVRDKAWIEAVDENLRRGEAAVQSSKDIDDLLSSFTATLLRQVFLQIGMLPTRRDVQKVSLSKENWKLNNHRSVQYVQSKVQIEALFWSEQYKQIGTQEQMKLRDEHRFSGSELPYSEWCRQREI
jgi:hypothetical protein